MSFYLKSLDYKWIFLVQTEKDPQTGVLSIFGLWFIPDAARLTAKNKNHSKQAFLQEKSSIRF